MSAQITLSPYEEKELIWNDISALESWREYHYKDDGVYRINDPILINVQRSDRGDSHRIIDAGGIRHYIPPTWLGFSFAGVYGIGIKPVKKPE